MSRGAVQVGRRGREEARGGRRSPAAASRSLAVSTGHHRRRARGPTRSCPQLRSSSLPVRCGELRLALQGDRRRGARATLGDVGDRRSLEVGEGIATEDGAVVGLLHSPATGAQALVARLAGRGRQLGVGRREARMIAPDAPPPKPLVAGGAIYAAYVARAPGGERRARAGTASRQFVIKTIGSCGADRFCPRARRRVARVRRGALRRRESCGAGLGRGRSDAGITVAVVLLAGIASGRPFAARASSRATLPIGADAARRLAPRAAGGWWVAWLAHRWKPSPTRSSPAPSSGSAIEAPAEDRAYSWIEIVAVGEDGAPRGSAAPNHAGVRTRGLVRSRASRARRARRRRPRRDPAARGGRGTSPSRRRLPRWRGRGALRPRSLGSGARLGRPRDRHGRRNVARVLRPAGSRRRHAAERRTSRDRVAQRRRSARRGTTARAPDFFRAWWTGRRGRGRHLSFHRGIPRNRRVALS